MRSCQNILHSLQIGCESGEVLILGSHLDRLSISSTRAFPSFDFSKYKSTFD